MAFRVLPYSIDNLIGCFVDGSPFTTRDRVAAKLHRVYFEEYFAALGARSIVVEEDYIDKDYLEDYAAYYDRCFQNYPRRTHRLHFFDVEIGTDGLRAAIEGGEGCEPEARLQQAYLGFVVVKPLPQSVVGRTCLRTYPDDSGRRHFPCLRTYDVNLFGMQLKVHSLAYQEQDTVVAACATSALWSCFQGTGKLFQHTTPPPVQITNWAGEHMPEEFGDVSARAFPNNGLTASQMAYAVRRVGLEPVVIGAARRDVLNGVAYAFLRGKIPSVLVYRLVQKEGDSFVNKGQHAVAITGFSLSDGPAIADPETGFQLRSTRIDKLYGHDDQVGPFARMQWCDPAEDGSLHPCQFSMLETSRETDIYADIDFLLLPLYHKIRIPYSLIHDAIMGLDIFMEGVRSTLYSDVPRGEWDIFLTTANDYKMSVRTDYVKWKLDREEALYKSMPRFMWRVLLRVNNQVQLDILFDATGIAQHNLIVHLVSRGAYERVLKMLVIASSGSGAQLKPQIAAVLDSFSSAQAQTVKKPAIPDAVPVEDVSVEVA
ncbi:MULTISPECIES: hypothetical protein [Pseudomonas]|uniref:hypothetical protein n=1 Tax=Pseudomonas TaxID=286 RepID=UPI001B81CAD7|nr:hypothetical protein [Pseudomonas juntendi]MBR7522023.1 hypothetical protein [Pseudomonas juntendi]